MLPQIDEALIKILTDALSDILPQPELVRVCAPDDPGNARLGLHLFAIRPCKDVTPPSISARGRGVLSLPPRFLTLYYLITAYGKADAPYRALEEHLILERAILTLEKMTVLTQNELGFPPGQWIDSLHVQLLDLDTEEMSHVHSFGSAPQKLSVAYKIEPVELSIHEGRMVSRVSGANTQGDQL